MFERYNPWFRVFPLDFISRTAHMSASERGVYIACLCYACYKGELPANRACMSRLGGWPRISTRSYFVVRARLDADITDGSLVLVPPPPGATF